MTEKKWIFFKVMVYVWLAATAGFLALIVYTAFPKSNSFHEEEIYALVAIAFLSLQIVFNILNVRLVHYYLFNKQMPAKSFKIWHTVLLIINVCIGILLLLALGELFKGLNNKPAYQHDNSPDVIAIVMLSSYLTIMFVTMAGSIRIRKYIRKYVVLEEETWLKQLGAEPAP